LGAGHPRVTHPFAARVPRRALPLDLHVLSTPPAFVLSQDQTLQQNLAKQTRPQHGGLWPHISGTNHQTRKIKLDTLLSSQKTPAHHPPPLGSFRGCAPLYASGSRGSAGPLGDWQQFGVRAGEALSAGVPLTWRKLREGLTARQIAPLVPALTCGNMPVTVTHRRASSRPARRTVSPDRARPGRRDAFYTSPEVRKRRSVGVRSGLRLAPGSVR
jgi:hypothetical protein